MRELLQHSGAKPRFRGNRLLFVAPDAANLSRLRDCVRTALAWASIVDDIRNKRLNIDQIQAEQANRELEAADADALRAARESYRWLLCQVMHAPTDRAATIEALGINTSGGSLMAELERVCDEHELIITAWGPAHLCEQLAALYWKDDKPAVNAMSFYEDTLRYLYLPRLRDRGVLETTIVKGAQSEPFFGLAYGRVDGRFEGFALGEGRAALDDTLLLIEPGAAMAYAAAQRQPEPEIGPEAPQQHEPDERGAPTRAGAPLSPRAPEARVSHCFGKAEVSALTARFKLGEIADEIIALLSSDPTAKVTVTLEINAEFPKGAPEHVRRGVAENARSLEVSVEGE